MPAIPQIDFWDNPEKRYRIAAASREADTADSLVPEIAGKRPK